MARSYSFLAWLVVVAGALGAALVAACGTVRDTAAIVGERRPLVTSDGGLGSLNGQAITSLAIEPSVATLVTSGAPATSQFRAIATLADGTTADVSTEVAWGSNAPEVGTVGSAGLYTASGALGGVVAISASTGGKAGAAMLTVNLELPWTPAASRRVRRARSKARPRPTPPSSWRTRTRAPSSRAASARRASCG